jgi:hypothetical protein
MNKTIKILIFILLVSNTVHSQTLAAFSKCDKQKTVFSGMKNIIYLHMDSMSSNDINVKLDSDDSTVALISKASEIGDGYYYLSPRKNFTGLLGIKVRNKISGEFAYSVFTVINATVKVQASIAGTFNSYLDKTTLENMPFINTHETFVESQNYDVPVMSGIPYKVISFTLAFKLNEKYNEFKFTGNKISEACLQEIKKMKSEDKIWVDEIRVKRPSDNMIIGVEPIIVKIQ